MALGRRQRLRSKDSTPTDRHFQCHAHRELPSPVSVQTTELPAFMKPRHILILSALTGTALAQGPLTPPPGADPSIGPANALNGGLPQAAMKTLHLVEPRTAIAGGKAMGRGWPL